MTVLTPLPSAPVVQIPFCYFVVIEDELVDTLPTWHAADGVAFWYQRNGKDARIVPVY